MVDKAIFNWFLSMRLQNVSLSAGHESREGTYIRQRIKCCKFPSIKGLNVDNLQALDGWLRLSKERNHITFKTILGESKSVTPELVDWWWERLF